MTIRSRLGRFAAFLRDNRGVTAIEYGLIAATLAVALILIVFTVGDDLQAMWQFVSDAIGNFTPG